MFAIARSEIAAAAHSFILLKWLAFGTRRPKICLWNSNAELLGDALPLKLHVKLPLIAFVVVASHLLSSLAAI
jgi:hypothetical protein